MIILSFSRVSVLEDWAMEKRRREGRTPQGKKEKEREREESSPLPVVYYS